MRRDSFFPLIVALLLVLAACGSSTAGTDTATAVDDESSSADESGTESTESANDDSSSDEESSDPWEDFESPIQEFLGIDYANFDDADFEAEFAEDERRVQESITTCMRALGWEYEPVDNSSFISGGAFDADGLEWGSDEWVELYGFGITTQAFAQSQVGPDLLGYDDSEFQDFEEQALEDPNAEFLSTLSETEVDAFYQDLYGDFPEFDETLTEEELNAAYDNFEPTGCEPAAYEESYGGGEQEFYEAFGDELDDMYTRIEADPRIVEAQSELASCLVEAGHAVTADEDLWQQFYEMFDAEIEPLYEASFSDPFEGLDFESMTEEEINAVLDSSNPAGAEFAPAQLELLAGLQAQELELSADVLSCEPGFFSGAGVDDVFLEVLAEYEQAFLDENSDALVGFAGSGSE